MPGDITELFNAVNANLASPQGSISFDPAGQQGVANVAPQITTQPVGEPQLIDFIGGFEQNQMIQPVSNLEVMPTITSSVAPIAPQPETQFGNLLRVATAPITNTGSVRLIS